MKLETIDDAIQASHRALESIIRGDVEPFMALYSDAEDITIGNPFGPFASGHAPRGHAARGRTPRSSTLERLSAGPRRPYPLTILGVKIRVRNRRQPLFHCLVCRIPHFSGIFFCK